jgi:hypothetical protein
MTNKNITPVVNILRTIDIESLRNQIVIENLIRCFGLVYDVSEPFGDDNKYFAGDRQTTGIYQIPGQMAPALISLSYCHIKTYLEIGTFQGGAFVFTTEYLKRFGLELNISIDITSSYINDDIKPYHYLAPGTSNVVKGQDFDLVMIDGDHAYESVKKDFENVGQYAKYCMIHDINEVSSPDVKTFFDEIKSNYHLVREFLYHSHGQNVQGIGILKIK